MNDMVAPGMHAITAGLKASPAHISPKYFYDVRGSALFEDITRLPEYYPTRVEQEIMSGRAADIAVAAGAASTVIELGAGNCKKARRLCQMVRPDCYVGIDISGEFLHQSIVGLRADFPTMDLRAVPADITRDIDLPADLPLQRRLVFYPGSSIGNFDPPQALQLLSRMRRMLGEDGALLIGVDLVKDVTVLEAAYNDSAGITAAFNLNVLTHVNRLIGSDFDERQWQHRAFFDSAASRIEMHVEAVATARVRWPGGERRVAKGERIHTENSYKYTIDGFLARLAEAGLHLSEAWTDQRNWFGVLLARP